MSLPPADDWNYPGLRKACANRADGPLCAIPCGECWRDVGVERGDEFDEAAAIARLL